MPDGPRELPFALLGGAGRQADKWRLSASDPSTLCRAGFRQGTLVSAGELPSYALSCPFGLHQFCVIRALSPERSSVFCLVSILLRTGISGNFPGVLENPVLCLEGGIFPTGDYWLAE